MMRSADAFQNLFLLFLNFRFFLLFLLLSTFLAEFLEPNDLSINEGENGETQCPGPRDLTEQRHPLLVALNSDDLVGRIHDQLSLVECSREIPV